ncbi:hypothetical protein EMCRGX_G010061 [Ephydatia muelleri]
MLPGSQSFLIRLDDSVEDDGPKPGSTAMDCTGD